MQNNIPEGTAIILVKNVGHIIPKDMLELAFSNFPSAFGYASRDGDELTVEASEPDDIPSIDDVMKVQEENKDQPFIFWLAKLPAGYDMDIAQPFAFRIAGENDEEIDIVAVAIEGDFPKYNTKDMVSEAHNVMGDVIYPELELLVEAVDGDEDEFYKKLPSIKKSLDETVGHRGVFAMMTTTGVPLIFGKNELGKVYDWGETSNNLGYGEKMAIADKPTLTAKKSKFGSRKAPAETMKPEASKPLPEGVHLVQDKPTPKAPENNPKAPELIVIKKHPSIEGLQWLEVPKGFHGKTRKAWIRQHIPCANRDGRLPDDWENILGLWVKSADYKQTMTNDTILNANAVPEKNKALNSLDTLIAAAKNLTITEPERTRSMEMISKYLDASANVVPMSPLELQKVESKYATFSDKICGVHELLPLKSEDFIDIYTRLPATAQLSLMLEMRRIIYAANPPKARVKASSAVVDKVVEATVTAAAELQNVKDSGKRGRFSFGKRKAA